jgi:RHS repeat-associated protein
LKIAGISSTKAGDVNEGELKNRRQYQGAFSEYDEDIQWNDFALRNYDPQIARWVQQDPYQQFASPYVALGGDPVNMIDPSGGWSIAAGLSKALGISKIGVAAVSTFVGAIAGAAATAGSGNAKGMIVGAFLGLASNFVGGGGGAIGQIAVQAVIGGGKILANNAVEKVMPTVAPKQSVVTNTGDVVTNATTNSSNTMHGPMGDFADLSFEADALDEIDNLSEPWILYDGTNVTVYEGIFGNTNKSKVITKSQGTSGYINHQVAEEQTTGGGYPGPVPEGDYKINLELDPNRVTVVDPESGGTNQAVGIQKIPKSVRLNNGYVQDMGFWGTIRARLERAPGNPSIQRDNFYLHDSDKGYSHGCIETSKSKIFNALLNYRKQGIKKIRVKVKYPSPKTKTNGGPHGK